MTRRDPRLPLRQIVEHAREAIEMARGASREDLDRDRKLDLSLTRLLEIIGEAAARLPPEERARYPEIPWTDIVGIDKSGVPTDIGSTAHASDFCYMTSHDFLSCWTSLYSIDFYSKLGHYEKVGGLDLRGCVHRTPPLAALPGRRLSVSPLDDAANVLLRIAHTIAHTLDFACALGRIFCRRAQSLVIASLIGHDRFHDFQSCPQVIERGLTCRIGAGGLRHRLVPALERLVLRRKGGCLDLSRGLAQPALLEAGSLELAQHFS